MSLPDSRIRSQLGQMWRVSEGRAKDFFNRLRDSITISYARDGRQQHWRYGNGSIVVIGHQIVTYRGSLAEMHHMVSNLVNQLRSRNVLNLGQLDQWTVRPEETKLMHQVLSQLIEDGALEEGPSRGNWNFFPITGTHNPLESLGEADEQLPLFKPPASFAPGSVKKFMASLHKGYSTGEPVQNGRRFRRLVGQFPNKGVYLWEKPRHGIQFNWSRCKIVVVLLLSQGYGNPQKEWPVEQEWACFSVLKDALRTWRNLQGSALFINSVPAGTVSYRNPHLQ